jgi:hypothetical protein
MKNVLQIALLTLLIIGCKIETKKEVKDEHQHHQVEKKEASKKKVLSPHTYAMAMVGDAHVHIDYSSPGVRGRIIFGGLLAYDEVWQSGAHRATWLETNNDLSIEGKTLKAGKYGVFTIPSKGEWTVIFNTNWDQHGKDEYDEKDDVLRFKVTPELSDEITEHLVYKVEKTDDTQGSISLSWEKVTIRFPFQIQ